MQTSTRDGILKAMHLLKILAGILLLVAFSWEMLRGDERHFTHGYLVVQLVVCLLFLLDFFVGWSLAERPGRYFGRHFLVLLLAIPWINIVGWCGCRLSHDWAVLVGLLPLLLIVLATWFLLEWLGSIRVHRIFFTYLCGVLLFTYFAALVFYDLEAPYNHELTSFGNALWWSGLNLSTAGAPIEPMSVVGKILSVVLPIAGMLFLPIFTTYIMNRDAGKKGQL